MPFHELAQHLSHKSTIKDLKRIGMVVVRDVIADADAQAVGEEIRAYTQARSGHRKSSKLLGSHVMARWVADKNSWLLATTPPGSPGQP